MVARKKTAASGQQVALSFEVSDTGIGIAGDQLDSIFESFIQADHSSINGVQGTG